MSEKYALLSETDEQIEWASSGSLCNFVKIVLLGKTGSGKSASGNTILRKEAFVEDFLPVSVTTCCKKETAETGGMHISVIDTPGIFGTSLSNDQLRTEIEKYMNVRDPLVFLLVIRLDRFTDEERNSVKWIQENLGEEASIYTIVLFTHFDQLKDKPLEQFVIESTEISRLINKSGDRYHAFNNEDKENFSQVTELLEKIKKLVVRNGKHCYIHETYLSAQKNRREIEKKKRTEELSNTFFGLIQEAVNISVEFLKDRALSAASEIRLGTVAAGIGGLLLMGTVTYGFLPVLAIIASKELLKMYKSRNRQH